MINSNSHNINKTTETPNDQTPSHHPHDKMFFASLKNHDIARDAIRGHVPAELVYQLDLTRMASYKTKLVSPQMKEFQADILYVIPFADSTALLLFHCEHESKPKRTITLKVWQYLFLVLMEYAENHPDQPLPVPFPLIVYTGETEFKYSTVLFDLFGEHHELTKRYFLQGIPLIDVCRMDDQDIKKRTLFGLSEFAFKHKKSKNFEIFLETAIPWLHRVEIEIGTNYAIMFIQYVVEVFRDEDFNLFKKMAKRYLSQELEKEAMTIAQQLKQEERMNTIREVALNMINSGVKKEDAAKFVKISLRELEELLRTIDTVH